jgi:hypothetical protein
MKLKLLKLYKINYYYHVTFQQMRFYVLFASVAEWLRSLTSNHLPITAEDSNPDWDFGFFRVRKLPS